MKLKKKTNKPTETRRRRKKITVKETYSLTRQIDVDNRVD